jgi:hypothetical protein
MTMFTTIQSAATPTIRRSALLLIARLRCFLNGWVAAAIAYREQAAAPRSCVKLRSIAIHCKQFNNQENENDQDDRFERRED